MDREFASDIAFTPAVKAAQEKQGSRETYARMESGRGWQTEVDDNLAAFAANLDSFYFATASADGQPYVQHRGGPRGFLKALDAQHLAFADYRGNRQYISVGNLSENDRVQLFLIDYPTRQRIKVWGRARVVEDDPDLLSALSDAAYKARPERAIVVTVEAWDVNCPQHITPRYTEDQILALIAPLKARIAALESQLPNAGGTADTGDG